MIDPAAELNRARRIVGGGARLARLIGVTPQAVSQWARAPAERALAIERATAGAVTRYDLRPDVFGQAPRRARRKAA